MNSKKTLIVMVLINLISILSGFIRDSSIAISLGATATSDVFMFIINVPTVLFSSLGWVIMSTFVPTYTDVMINQDRKNLNEFSNTFIKVVVMFTSCIVLILLGFNKFMIKILAPGFLGDSYVLAKQLFFIITPSLIFLSISYCSVAILNASKKMIWVPMLGIPINIMTIVAVILIFPKYGIHMATAIVLVGSILQMILMTIPLIKTPFRFTMYFNLKDENIKKMISMLGPMFIGVMAQQINSIFGGAITSTLTEGSLTSYNLATKIINATYNSIILIGISYIYPYLSHDFASGMIDKFKNTISKSLNLIFLILMPITVLIIHLNEEIITILYGYGKFTSESINITSKILVISSFGILFMGIRELLYRAYYSARNTKTPMKYSVLGIVINIFLAIVLSKKLGIIGVAMASSISILISTVCIYIKFKKEFNSVIFTPMIIIKYIIITVILFYSIKMIKVYISYGVFITAIILPITTIFIYILLILILKINIKEYLK